MKGFVDDIARLTEGNPSAHRRDVRQPSKADAREEHFDGVTTE